MAYGLSDGHVTDDVTWPPKVLWGSTVGYPSDSLASCLRIDQKRSAFSFILGVPITLDATCCTIATKLGVVAKNFPLGGFENFHSDLFKISLNFGFKSYVVNVIVSFCTWRFDNVYLIFLQTRYFPNPSNYQSKKKLPEFLRSSNYI